MRSYYLSPALQDKIKDRLFTMFLWVTQNIFAINNIEIIK